MSAESAPAPHAAVSCFPALVTAARPSLFQRTSEKPTSTQLQSPAGTEGPQQRGWTAIQPGTLSKRGRHTQQPVALSSLIAHAAQGRLAAVTNAS